MTNYMIARIWKVLFITFFLFMAAVFPILRLSAVTGYELSIYDGTPPIIWCFLIFGVVLGVGFLIREVPKSNSNNWWILGFLLIMLINFIALTLPAYRGYYVAWWSDPVAQLGWSKDILDTSYLEATDQYPFNHLVMAALTNIGGISLIAQQKYLQALPSLLYMVGVYLLATVFLKERKQQILVAASSVPLLFSVYQGAWYPQGMAHLQLPLLLYLYTKERESRSLKYRLPLLIVIICIAFWHPVTALTASLGLIILELIFFVKDFVFLRNKKVFSREITSSIMNLRLTPALIIFTITLAWVMGFPGFTRAVQIAKIISTTGENIRLENVMSQVQLRGWDLVEWTFRSHFPVILYDSLFGLATLLIGYKILKKKDESLGGLFSLSLFMIIGEIFQIALFQILGWMGFARLVRLDNILFLTPIFVGFLFSLVYERLTKKFTRKIIILIISILIATMWISSFFTHYQSSIINLPNPMLTRHEMYANEWLISNKKAGIYWNGLAYTHVYPYINLGFHLSDTYENIITSQNRGFSQWRLDIPPHFGYPYVLSLGEAASKNVASDALYMVNTVRYWKTIESKPIMEKLVSSFHLLQLDITMDDMERLLNDKTVDKLYSNSEVDIYYIRIRDTAT